MVYVCVSTKGCGTTCPSFTKTLPDGVVVPSAPIDQRSGQVFLTTIISFFSSPTVVCWGISHVVYHCKVKLVLQE